MSDTNPIKNKNRRGQASETITWIVALIVIVFILGSSIVLSSEIAKVRKSISSKELNTGILERDILFQQSVFAYFNGNSQKQDEIYSEIEQLKDEGKFIGNIDSEIEKLSKNLKK